MQERPNAEVVLLGLARLLTELRGGLSDKGLAFRALIGAHLASTLAAELGGADARARAELASLLALLGLDEPVPTAESEVRARLSALNARFDAAIAADALDPAAVEAHLRAVLAAQLRVTSPRFDLRDGVEEE